MNEILLIASCAIGTLSVILCLVVLNRLGKAPKTEDFVKREDLDRAGERIERSLSAVRREIGEETSRSLESFSRSVRAGQSEVFDRQDKRIQDLTQNTERSLEQIRGTVETSTRSLRETVDAKLKELRENNEKSLNEIRQSVDEKLQSTLEDRITKSFREVSDRLREVYQGLGEMQTLANGVGDLKKVLGNVKTRGILGEIQLGAILEEILSPEQYETNVVTVPGSRNPVEYAVRLPGERDSVVYLPIDSKFPVEPYLALQNAYEAADPDLVKEAAAQLEKSIKSFAKAIHTKYVEPPHTTDFAIMFLPTEGLYAEVVRMGMVETLQRNYKINIAGPTTMAALLNSLQTGFRTLAIQKRSSEVWEVLGAVRTEFEKFEKILRDTQARLQAASTNLEDLVGVRTRQMQKKLKDVSALPQERAAELLREENDAEE